MRTTKQRRNAGDTIKSLAREVRRIRHDIDLLGMQRKMDALLLRVSHLEIAEADRQD